MSLGVRSLNIFPLTVCILIFTCSSLEHNLPDSLFSSPKKSDQSVCSASAEMDDGVSGTSSLLSSTLFPAVTSSRNMASLSSRFAEMPRYQLLPFSIYMHHMCLIRIGYSCITDMSLMWSYFEQEAVGMMWVSTTSMEGFDFRFWVSSYFYLCKQKIKFCAHSF